MKGLKITLVLSVLMALAIMSCSDHFNANGPQNVSTTGPALNLSVPIDSAILTIYVFSGGSGTVNVNRMNVDWDENVVTWNSLYSGGFNTGQFDPTVLASFDVGTAGAHNINITSLVQGWIDGTNPNFGLALTKFDSPLGGFASSEWSTLTWHPRIVIYFTENGSHQTVVNQRGIDGTVNDTYVFEGEPDTNFGTADELFTGLFNGLMKQTLIKFPVPQTPPEEGCTHTIGYWKTHAGFGPQADVVTPLLPQYLGNQGGVSTLNVNTALIAYNVLSMNVYGTSSNGITKLYAQLLGAKLSIASGASDAVVAATITAADNFLSTHSWTSWSGLSQSDKNMVLGWMTTLDNYNNGLIGPSHCE